MGLPGLFGVGTAGVTDLLESAIVYADIDAICGLR